MADSDSEIVLKKLDQIYTVIFDVREDIVYLKTRDEEQKREWPQTQIRLREIEHRIATTEQKLVVLNSRSEKEEAFFRSMSNSLAELNKKMEGITSTSLPEISRDVDNLKTKATIWGGIAGTIIATLITIAIKVAESLRG